MLGCSLHGHVLSACVSRRLPACARAADLVEGLARDSCCGWVVGTDAAVLTRDCRKTHHFNPDYGHHHFSLACTRFSVFPSSLLSCPHVRCSPSPSRCSFSCFPPSKPRQKPILHICCHGDHICHFSSFVPLIC